MNKMTNLVRMQSAGSMTSNISNTSSFWWNGGQHRKRKIADSDMEEKSNCKIFLTEEKLAQNMQTLSLDLSVVNNNSQDNEQGNQTQRSAIAEPQIELHQLLKDNLRPDGLIDRLCTLERRKFSMQIVPYMPVHPAQLNSHAEEKEKQPKKIPTPPIPINPVKNENDDISFKRPFTPLPYTVEEPPENTNKRPARMKRSYSQSIRSNSNLSVIELRNDTPIDHPSAEYLISEPPSTPSVLDSSTTNNIPTSYTTSRPSIRITEYFDFSPNENDVEPMVFSDTFDQMDEDV